MEQLRFELENGRFDALKQKSISTLNSGELDSFGKSLASVYLSISLSLEEPDDKLDSYIEQCREFAADETIHKLSPDQHLKHMQTYARYMLKLKEWRKNNPQYYQKSAEKIHLISNSHSLTSAYAGFEGKYQIIPHLIWNIRVYFLNKNSEEREIAQFESVINSLPKNSRVIIQLGEVDCRINAGFFKKYLKEENYNLEVVIKKTVSAYVEYLKHVTAGKNFDIIIANVNCLNQSVVLGALLKMAAESNTLAKKAEIYSSITKIFNQELEKATKGFAKIIDIYTPTIGYAGLGDPAAYIDPYHLKPNILIEALEKL